jgi:CRP-like cAMP-binding protein
MNILTKCALLKTYHDREHIFYQGETENGVYFLVKGRAQVFQTQWDGTRQRIGTLCPGTSIGEMALIDQRPRSADVIAEGIVVCFHITSQQMEQLSQEHFQLSYKLLGGIAKELSIRLRFANKLRAGLNT